MLEGECSRLVPITMDDTENIIRWRNQPFVQKRFIYREEFTIESHTRWMEKMVNTGKVKQFIIYERNLNQPIGSAYLRDIDYKNAKAEYGIFIGEEEFVGKGIGSEVAKLMLKYAFKELNLNKVMLRVFQDNVRAITSYKNAGFEVEGCFQDDVRIEGHFYNVVYMGKIRNKAGRK